MPASAQTILVLGGGVGGVVVAVELRKRLGDRHRVVLVEREERHVFQPSLLWLMIGRRTARQISRPVDRLRRRGIDVVRGEIEAIDPANRSVTVGGCELRGDAVVISLGADLAADSIDGLPAAGHNFYTLGGAESLFRAVSQLRGGRVAVMTAAPAYKCPAAPYEAAMLIDDFFRRRAPGAVRVDVYAAEPAPMGVAGPHVSAAVVGMLEAKGIAYHPGHQVASVSAEERRLHFANGASADFDLLAYVPPHRAPRVVRESSLASELGWIAVDRNTMQTAVPGVWAIGDVTTIPLKLGKPLPKAGVFAHRQAETVARNLAHAIEGKDASASFDGQGECFIETGNMRAAFGSGDFYAEPVPVVDVRQPSIFRHLAKVLFEQQWLRRWF
jgi:sulfide:quinone oxidoreductase